MGEGLGDGFRWDESGSEADGFQGAGGCGADRSDAEPPWKANLRAKARYFHDPMRPKAKALGYFFCAGTLEGLPCADALGYKSCAGTLEGLPCAGALGYKSCAGILEGPPYAGALGYKSCAGILEGLLCADAWGYKICARILG